MSNQKNNIYKDYYSTHTWYLKASKIDRKRFVQNVKYRIDSHIKSILKDKDKSNIRVLDIWCGQGYFAEYCKNIWVKYFTGFDLDNHIIDYCKKILPEYIFSAGDIHEHLLQNKDTYDIVFMSHVFEHITLDKVDNMIQLIYSSLNQWWIWINIMPNAGSLFMWTYGRYIDLTHIKIYDHNSFSQLLMSNNIWIENIKYYNYYNPTILKTNSRIFMFWTKIFSYFFKIIISLAWYPTSHIHTFEILTIITKRT